MDGTTNGKILRFTQGKEIHLSLKAWTRRLGRGFWSIRAMIQNVCVDSQNNRVSIDKEGTYLAQYRFTAAPALTGLVVFECRRR